MTQILVVEDDPDMRDIISMTLEDAGYQVLLANDGQQGLECLERTLQATGELPSLILSDVMMPRLDGVQMCNILHQHPTYRVIPVVLITAANTATFKGKCAYADFIKKPFDIDKMLNKVAHYISY